MPQTINSFNAGELSPRVVGRWNWEKYASGCRQLENFIPYPHGGVTRRPGTKHVANVKNHALAVRLIPFVFNINIAYCLEFGENTDGIGYIRFYRDDVQIGTVDDPAIPFEVTTPYLASELRSLRFKESADVMYISSPTHPTQKLSRGLESGANPDTDWTLAEAVFDGGPFLLPNDTDTTIIISFDEWTDAPGTEYVIDDVVSVFAAPLNLQAIAVTQFGTDKVKMSTVSAIHGFKTGETIKISGTTNYDGVYQQEEVDLDTDGILITHAFIEETLVIDVSQVTKATYYKALTTHTPNADPPPANTTDWLVTSGFTGSALKMLASADLFEADHIGALFKLSYTRGVANLNGTFFSTNFSIGIPVVTGWSFVTNGTWNGRIEIQRSEDNGETYIASRSFSSFSNRNVLASGTEEEENILYRIAMVEHSFGSVTWDFTPDELKLDGIVKITDFTSATQVTATVIEALPRIGETKDWCEGAWSVKNGFPRVIAFFEERLVLGGTTANPLTIWGSTNNRFENFRAGVNDNQSFIFDLASDTVNQMEWIESSEALLIGTAGGEWRIGASNTEEPLTPTNVLARRQSGNGSMNLQGVLIDDSILFVQRTGRKLRELSFNFDRQAFVAPDLSIQSEHITESGIVECASAPNHNKIFWLVRSDGVLLSFTYNRIQEVFAWARHTTDGSFESVAVVPGADEDQIYLSVKRIINGATERHIELMKPQAFTDKDDAWFVDDALEYPKTSSPIRIQGITTASPGVVTTVSDHGLVTNDHVRITGWKLLEGMNEVWQVEKILDNTFSLKNPETGTAIDTSLFTVVPLEIVTVLSITNETEAVVTTATAHAFENGQQVHLGVSGMTELNLLNFNVRTLTGTTFNLISLEDDSVLDTTHFNEFISGGAISVGTMIEVENTFAGLEHLENKIVQIIGDGNFSTPKRVVSGSVTADDYFVEAKVGLNYESILEPSHPENQSGASQGIKSRISKTGLQLDKSSSFKIGPALNNLQAQSFSDVTEITDEGPGLFTGYKNIQFPPGYHAENPIIIVQDKPLPLTVLSFIIEMKSSRL